MPSAGMACSHASQRFCGGSKPGGTNERLLGSAAYPRSPPGSRSTIDSASGAEPEPRGRRECRASQGPVLSKADRLYRTEELEVRRRERSSGRPTGTHQAERGRSRPRPANRVPDDSMDRAVPQGEYKPEHILHEIEEAEGREVTVIVGIPSSGAAIASLIGRDDMEPSGRERHHDLPPAVGEFRKPVKEGDTRPILAFAASFQRVDTKAVVVVHEP